MNDIRKEKQQWILLKAVEIYSKKGNVTIRELAAAADMNVASINYYFGSKENLIVEVEKQLFDLFDKAANEANSLSISEVEKLYALMSSLVKLLIENPGAARYFYRVLGQGNDENILLLSGIFEESVILKLFEEAVKSVGLGLSRQEILYRYFILLCSLAPPFLFGMMDKSVIERFKEVTGPNFEINDNEQDDFFTNYIDTAIKCALCNNGEKS